MKPARLDKDIPKILPQVVQDETPPPGVPKRKVEQPLPRSESVQFDAAFAAWTNAQLPGIIRDCQQASAALVEEAMETIDLLQTMMPSSPVWNHASRGNIRSTLLEVVGACQRMADSVVRDVPSSSSQGVKTGGHVALGITPEPTLLPPHAQLVGAIQQFYAALLVRAEATWPALQNGAEAQLVLHNGYLAHIEYMTRRWADFTLLVEDLRFLRTPLGARYAFLQRAQDTTRHTDLKAAVTDPLVLSPETQAAYQQRLAAYGIEVENIRKDNRVASDSERQFFQHAFIAENLFYHGIGRGEGVDLALKEADQVILRPRGLPWLGRPDASSQRVTAVRAQAEHLMAACFSSTHLPSPLPASSIAAKRLGYRLTLPSITLTAGALPTTMAAAAAGLIPWAVVSPKASERQAAAWHQKMLDAWALDAMDEDKILPDERSSAQPNPYGRQEDRHAPSLWLDVLDRQRVDMAMARERKNKYNISNVYALSPLGEDLLIASATPRRDYVTVASALEAATLLPRIVAPMRVVPKEMLATPCARTVAWLHGQVDSVAAEFVAAGRGASALNVSGYLRSICPWRTLASFDATRMTSGLLSIYLQLPWLDALNLSAQPQQQDENTADAEALRHVLQVLIVYDTLVLAFQLLTTPGATPWLSRRRQEPEGDDDNDDDDDEEEAEAERQQMHDLTFQHLAQRFLTTAKRRLPPYLLDALLAVREVVQTGAYGPIDFSHDFGSHASPPVLRQPVLALGILNVHVRAGVMYLLLRDYLGHWRKEHDKGSVHAQIRQDPLTVAALLNWAAHDYNMNGKENKKLTSAEKEMNKAKLERALPHLLRVGVAPSVAASMGDLTIGAAHYASVLTMCGLDLGTPDLVMFCVRQSLRGGLASTGTNQLVRLASQLGHPDTHLGLPKISAGRCLDAQHALRQLLLLPRSKVDKGELPSVLQRWIAMVRRAMERHKERSVPLDEALCGLEEEKEEADYPLFLNAVHLKYALRGHLQRLGLFVS